MNSYLILPHMQIQNANAHSSPYTIGFPAVTAWLGAMHALERKLNAIEEFKDVSFSGVGIVSHSLIMRSLGKGRNSISRLIGMGFPSDKNGNRAPFLEEAKCNLEISLIVEFQGFTPETVAEFIESTQSIILSGLRMASGDVLSMKRPLIVTGEGKDALDQVKRHVMPGYVLLERRELMIDAMKEGIDAMDALLSFLEIRHTCSDSEPFCWEVGKRSLGWIVPISVGYQQISPMFQSSQQRDFSVPHLFAESVITLGEFVMPYRLSSVEESLWRYSYEENNGLYLCKNGNV
ncbi:CRISPR-associated protein Csy2 [bioreactor metagenome]|uniref:CRISPR-associated protein Csy2 n=1 Tax=bioreactor metagenome TaxID=1076179 RepID=A0A644XRR5_9ZZZZ|nr:type I-F CRISPR-associated protein Csy2 [Sphaerochaeta associata]MEA5028134.1 type I-F CRISPR-associated protein Csy2 [Sphaerochaeta associata]